MRVSRDVPLFRQNLGFKSNSLEYAEVEKWWYSDCSPNPSLVKPQLTQAVKQKQGAINCPTSGKVSLVSLKVDINFLLFEPNACVADIECPPYAIFTCLLLSSSAYFRYLLLGFSANLPFSLIT